MSNNERPLPARNRCLFERLVCEDGLGYCCPYALFRVTKQTGAIALRLGMTTRAVRFWKAKFNSKELQCQQKATCLLPHIKTLGK